MHKLTAAQVKAARPKTMIADGGGLYLLTEEERARGSDHRRERSLPLLAAHPAR
jgi:hypothetical protein